MRRETLVCLSGNGFGTTYMHGADLRGEGGEGDGVDEKMCVLRIPVSAIGGPV